MTEFDQARAEAEAIIRAAASRATRAWVEDQRAAGRTADDVAAEIRASKAEAAAIIERHVCEVARLMLAIAEGGAEGAFDIEAEVLRDPRRQSQWLH